jgi:hypothetical protein
VSEQLDLRFSGATYEPVHDRDRLAAQLTRTWTAMKDGQWRTLWEIQEITDDPLQSISARLRDFRKERFGSHTVNRRRIGPERGTFQYQLVPNETGGK